jgi:hypothetical protein
MYGGMSSEGMYAMDSTRGVDFDLVPKLGRTKILSEGELEYYTDEYSRKGLEGPCMSNFTEHYSPDNMFKIGTASC